MSKTIIVTGASSGFGALTARALAEDGHNVFAGIRHTKDRNATAVAAANDYARANDVQLQAVDMDVSDQASVTAAIEHIVASAGPIDVVVHNAGHMVLGPAESFSVDQLAEIYDTNVLSTQRVNQAVLPGMRERRDGLLVWVGSSSTYGGTPPYLGPYFAAKAAEDHLAKSYAVELARFGIDTALIIPGSFTSGTEHFAHAMMPAGTETAQAYEQEYQGLMDQVGARLAELAPPDADVAQVAQAIVKVVDTEKGRRPFRTTIDPANDGSQLVSDLADQVRAEFYERIRMTDLLTVRT